MCGLRTYDKIRNPHRRVATKPQPYGERNRNPSGSETATLRVAKPQPFGLRRIISTISAGTAPKKDAAPVIFRR